jgi:CRISPR-associated protein Cas5h
MKILVFDILGKMAHFRQYYTNSSSLSYFFPPRTTICGMVAGILGLPRDSYYELFSEEKTRIALSIRSPLRKRVQTINYVWAEKPGQFNLSKGQHTQVPLELVLPQDYRGFVVYRLFFWHHDEQIFSQLQEMVSKGRVCFPLYLGISECLAHLSFVGFGETEREQFDGEVGVCSVVGMEYLRKNGCFIAFREGAFYVKELMPFSFDSERRLNQPPREFVGEVKTGTIGLRGRGEVYQVHVAGHEERIVFMED